MLAQHLGTQFVHVPYRSGAQMLQAIHTGEAQFGIAALASANAMVRDGLARGVAVTGTERFPTYPDIPTLAESGVPGFEFTVFYILVGPPGMAPATAGALNRALVASPARRHRCATGCSRPATRPGGPRTAWPRRAPSSSARSGATARSCGAPACAWKLPDTRTARDTAEPHRAICASCAGSCDTAVG